MRFPFLTARWLNLILLSYRLEPAFLQPFVPPGCELDLVDGSAFASLVAFDFADTRVLGVRWPGYSAFPEINLRIYVRRRSADGQHERGVCFIRELVPHRLVAGLARRLYNEPYLMLPMTSRVQRDGEHLTITHEVTCAGRRNIISVTAQADTVCPPAGSVECFFKEHEWCFGTSRSGGLIRYPVEHPIWNVHPVVSHHLDWDWSHIYGSRWAILQQQEPHTIILAEGSAVKVFPYGTLVLPG